MKKTNIILAILVMVASIASAQQVFTNVTLQEVRNQTSITFMLPSEVNTTNFRVEASNDGTEYKIIGLVQSKGNTVLPRTYTYRILETGYKYYRVGKVTMGGSLSYSQPLELKAVEDIRQIPATGAPTQSLATTTR
jgi:hypothetical protein